MPPCMRPMLFSAAQMMADKMNAFLVIDTSEGPRAFCPSTNTPSWSFRMELTDLHYKCTAVAASRTELDFSGGVTPENVHAVLTQTGLQPGGLAGLGPLSQQTQLSTRYSQPP